MNNARIERMLRELHAGPPLGFLEDVFALTQIVATQIAALRAARKSEPRVGATPLAAGGAAR